MDEFDKHLRSTNIPEEISSALSEGPGSILAIVVTKQKQKSQIVGSDYLIVLEHLCIIIWPAIRKKIPRFKMVPNFEMVSNLSEWFRKSRNGSETGSK